MMDFTKLTVRLRFILFLAFSLAVGFLPLMNGCAKKGSVKRAELASDADDSRDIDDYHVLATAIAEPMVKEREKKRTERSLSEAIIDFRTLRMNLLQIQSNDLEIAYLTTEASNLVDDIIKRLERIDTMPQSVSAEDVFVEGMLNLAVTGNPLAAFSGLRTAENLSRDYNAEIESLGAVWERGRSLQQFLPRVARRLASPVILGAQMVVVDYDGSWNSWTSGEWISLYNNSHDATDCTVIVHLKNENGDRVTNVHFIPVWESNSWRHAQYSFGTKYGSRTVGVSAVPDVTEIIVQVLSPDLSTEVSYLYEGEEKEKDIATYVESIRPHLDFSLRYSSWGTSYGMVLIVKSTWDTHLDDVSVVITSKDGSEVGKYTQARLQSGRSFEVGSQQIRRNLVAGDVVTLSLGGKQVHTKVVP